MAGRGEFKIDDDAFARMAKVLADDPAPRSQTRPRRARPVHPSSRASAPSIHHSPPQSQVFSRAAPARSRVDVMPLLPSVIIDERAEPPPARVYRKSFEGPTARITRRGNRRKASPAHGSPTATFLLAFVFALLTLGAGAFVFAQYRQYGTESPALQPERRVQRAPVPAATTPEQVVLPVHVRAPASRR